MNNSKLKNTMMSYKQLSLILVILLLLFTFSFACSPAVIPTDNNDKITVFTPRRHIKVSDGSSDITDSLFIAVNNSNRISITGLSNTVAPNKTYTLTISPVADLFSIDGNDISIEITAPEGFLSGEGVLSRDGVLSPDKSFTITNNNDSSNPIIYTLKVSFSGAPVKEWLTSDSLSTYIKATFSSQEASLILNENTLSVNGLLNDVNGTGTIKFDLPDGFEAIPPSIDLPDPDGPDIGEATINPSSTTFTIRESDNRKNSQPYTVDTISLLAITAFTPIRHITITDDSIINPTLSDITSTLSIVVNTDNQITITGLSNALNHKTYTLTIVPVRNIFGNTSGPRITISITEPDGFSPGNGGLSQGNGDPSPSVSFSITNFNDLSMPIIYTVVVPFSGAPVAEWLTETTFSTYFTGATFAGQTASLSFDGSTIAIGGDINNIPDGKILIATTLPSGYSLTQNLRELDGSGLAALTNAEAGSITITEDNNPDNTETYPLTISLAAYKSPVEASHVTAMFNDITAKPLNIEISGSNITISGFPNNPGSTGSGFVSITPPAEEYTVSPIEPATTLPFNFTDPDGTDSQDIVIGKVSVTSADITTVYTIIIRFSTQLELKIISDNVENSPLTITSGATLNIINLSACEILPPLAIAIIVVGYNTATLTGFPSYYDRNFDRKKDTSTGLAYTVNRVLIIEDVTGVLDDNFTVSIEGFPACDDVDDFTNTANTGVDADNAIEIDSAPKLELLSHLVRTDNANYGSKYYKLTANIDLGLAGLPWSETASGESGKGFPPIGIDETTSFQGTFDCANNSISNLYINKANDDDDDVGLFGHASGASIQNCSLLNIYVTGKDNVGGLAGSLLNASSIENSYTTGSVSGKDNVGGLVGRLYSSSSRTSSITNSYTTGSVLGNDNVGGLVGYLNSSSITNSYTTGSVLGNDNVGGLVGYLNSSSITNSHATGDVKGSNSVGGLTGYLFSSSSITNSYATGSVSGTERVGGLTGNQDSSSITSSYATGSVSGTITVGGLSGILTFSSSITNSYATGSVEGSNSVGGLVSNSVGGLVGFLSINSRITNSYATGLIISGTNSVGGLAGYVSGSTSRIENSYATGKVLGIYSIGGLVGVLDSGSVTNSYATGVVDGGEHVGGLAGFLYDASIENSYATGSVQGNVEVGGLVGVLDSGSVTNSYTTGDVEGTESVGLFIGYNGETSPTITILYTGVTDSYYNNEAVLSLITVDADTGATSTNTVEAKGVGSDGDTSDTTTMNLTGLDRSALQVSKGTTTGEPYSTWPEASWLFMAGQYPRLILVACPNRQYPADPSNVPTDCIDLQ